MFHLVIFKTQPALQRGGYHERQIFGNLGSELASCPKFKEAYRQAWFERREQIVSEKEVDWRRCSADCRAETKTIPSQGSRAPIMQQTFQGSFTALSKPMFASNHFARLKFSNLHDLNSVEPPQTPHLQNVALSFKMQWNNRWDATFAELSLKSNIIFPVEIFTHFDRNGGKFQIIT